MDRDDLGFLLAKATQRWNELLRDRFSAAGWADIRPSYGSLLVPLYEEDGLRLGELARRSRLSKQTMTTMARLLEREQLVRREPIRPTHGPRGSCSPSRREVRAGGGAHARRSVGARRTTARQGRLDAVKHDLKEWIEQ